MSRDIMIIVTGNNYPEGDAGSVRQHAFCKLFKELGYEPFVISMGRSTNFQENVYDGVNYVSLRYAKKHILYRIWGRLAFKKNLQRIIGRIELERIAGILVVSGGNPTFKWIESLGKKHNIPLYHDSVEWYSPEEFAMGKYAIAYRNNDRLNRVIIRKQWRVIAISKFLEAHFKKQSKAVVRIPVIMDVMGIRNRVCTDTRKRKICFAYVGAPAKKDYLAEIIKGFSMLPPEKIEEIELHVVGVNKEKLVSMCGAEEAHIHTLGDSLVIHGRLPRSEALQWVFDADYTLLLRDESLRYAKAGFPTKIVESLAHGTPPVCNFSSDLCEYLIDEENAFIVPGHTAEDVKETVLRIICRHQSVGEQMRINARKTAEQHFDALKYVDELRKLIVQ